MTQGSQRFLVQANTPRHNNRRKVAPVQFHSLPGKPEPSQDFGSFLTTGKAPEAKKISVSFFFKQDQRFSLEYQRL